MKYTMPNLEVKIANQNYVLKSDETEDHLRETTDLVKKKIESLLKKDPALPLHKATMLVAFDLASHSIKGRKKALEYRNAVVGKAQNLIDRVQSELSKE